MIQHLCVRYFLELVVLLLPTFFVRDAIAAQVATNVVAITGDPTPDGNSTFLSFNNPALNNAGQAAFRGFLTDTPSGLSDEGIFRGNGTSSLVQIARAGDVAPDGNGTFSDFGNPAMNDADQIAFYALLSGTKRGFDDNRGIFRGDGTSETVQIARTGDAAPDGNGFLFATFNSSA